MDFIQLLVILRNVNYPKFSYSRNLIPLISSFLNIKILKIIHEFLLFNYLKNLILYQLFIVIFKLFKYMDQFILNPFLSKNKYINYDIFIVKVIITLNFKNESCYNEIILYYILKLILVLKSRLRKYNF